LTARIGFKPLDVGNRVALIQRGYSTLLKKRSCLCGINPTLGIRPAAFGSDPNILDLLRPQTGSCSSVNLTLKSTLAGLNSPTASSRRLLLDVDPATIIGGRWNLAFPNVNDAPMGLLTPLGSTKRPNRSG